MASTNMFNKLTSSFSQQSFGAPQQSAQPAEQVDDIPWWMYTAARAVGTVAGTSESLISNYKFVANLFDFR